MKHFREDFFDEDDDIELEDGFDLDGFNEDKPLEDDELDDENELKEMEEFLDDEDLAKIAKSKEDELSEGDDFDELLDYDERLEDDEDDEDDELEEPFQEPSAKDRVIAENRKRIDEMVEQFEKAMVPVSDFIKEKIPKPRYLIYPILRETDLVMIHADRGTGKTWLSLIISVILTRMSAPF